MKKIINFLLILSLILAAGFGINRFILNNSSKDSTVMSTADNSKQSKLTSKITERSSDPDNKDNPTTTDAYGNQTTTLRVVALDQSFENGDFTYTINKIQFKQNIASQQGLPMATQALHVDSLPTEYQTAIISYTITSKNQEELFTDGIAQINFENQMINPAFGLDNDAKLGQVSITNQEPTKSFAIIYLPTNNANQLNNLSISFAPIYNQASQQIVGPSPVFNLELA